MIFQQGFPFFLKLNGHISCNIVAPPDTLKTIRIYVNLTCRGNIFSGFSYLLYSGFSYLLYFPAAYKGKIYLKFLLIDFPVFCLRKQNKKIKFFFLLFLKIKNKIITNETNILKLYLPQSLSLFIYSKETVR